MQYTWRIVLTAIILLTNILNKYYGNELSLSSVFPILFNGAIGWLIGAQIDKYRLSKRKLSSTQTALLDYSFAMDTIPEPIAITNEMHEFEFFNEAYAALYGYSKEEFSTINWKKLYSKDMIELLNNIVEPILTDNGHWKGEIEGTKKDGTTFPQELSLSLIKESKRTIGILRDMTEQKNFEEYMKRAAEHNELTNLPNRRRLMSDLEICKKEQKDIALLFMDLDRFKLINDNLGHDIGDEVLRLVANRLIKLEDETVKVYHHGGDEFIVVVQNQNNQYIRKLATQIINEIKKSFHFNGTEVYVTSSIGISLFPNHTTDMNHLIKMADTAMYDAKTSGKDTYKYFDRQLEIKQERRGLIEASLRKALQQNELYMVYQPKFKLDSSKMVGFEALIRWKHPEAGLISPGEFIPIAEESGIIIDIGKWVIYEVLQQMKIWQEQGYLLTKVSVNISQRQFRDKQLVETIRTCLQSFDIKPEFFEIEITESVMEELAYVLPILHSLKELGVGISIDDFGKGYSSLNILKDLPIDTLKVDQSFIRDLLEDPKDNLLVKTILQIAQNLDLNVVAEGIETEDHLKQLLKLKCPDGQGYYFSKPITAAELEKRYFTEAV